MLSANEALRALAASLEAEMNRLHEQVVDAARGERALRERARALSAQLDRTRARARATPRATPRSRRQNSNLANLYVASYQLHGTLDRKQVIDTIQEIIANLVGSEEAGLYELDPGTQTLELVASFGIGRGRAGARSRSAAAASAGRERSGEIFVADGPRRPGRRAAA